jgi:hypothetical protein
VWEGQRLQKYGVDDAEDRRACADGDGEGRDDDQRECREASCDAKGVARILTQRVERAATAHIAQLFRVAIEAAEPTPGLVAGAIGRHPAALERRGLHVDVEAQFVREIGIGVPAQEHAQSVQASFPGHGALPFSERSRLRREDGIHGAAEQPPVAVSLASCFRPAAVSL